MGSSVDSIRVEALGVSITIADGSIAIEQTGTEISGAGAVPAVGLTSPGKTPVAGTNGVTPASVVVKVHEQKPKIIEGAGKAIMVDPSQWSERRAATASMRLGYGEKDDMPQKLKGLYEGLAQDPALQNMFTPQNR